MELKCKKCNRKISVGSSTGLCGSCVQLGTQKALGFRHTQKAKDAIAKSKMGEKNVNWAGDKVGYSALHYWVSSRIKKPKLCSECKKRPARDLANKGIYDRNLDNWEWLCRRCHMLKDGRLEKLKNVEGKLVFIKSKK